MDYILRGNDKDVTNVLKEQRIRINRGMIQLIPISECGLVTEEDARKTLECMLAEKNEEIGRLTASIAEKDKTIVELTEESPSGRPPKRDGDAGNVSGKSRPHLFWLAAVDGSLRLSSLF